MSNCTEIFYGVGLILRNREGRIFTIKELKAKPIIQKDVGMISFPLETVECGESYDDALTRLIYEEMGCREINGFRITDKCYFFRRFADCAVYYCIYSADCHCGNVVFHPSDTDIVFNGWIHPNDIHKLDSVRVEMAFVE